MRATARELDGVDGGSPHVRGRTASDASMLAKTMEAVGGVTDAGEVATSISSRRRAHVVESVCVCVCVLIYVRNCFYQMSP